MFLVIAFDFEKYHDEAEEIKNIIGRYIYVDDEKAFKKCRKKWDEEMIIGIDGVQWVPENVGEIVAFTDEINEMPILSDLFGVWFAGCAKVRCHKGWSACGMEDIEM